MRVLIDVIICFLIAGGFLALFAVLVYWLTPEDERKSNEAFINMLCGKTKNKTNT